MTEKAQHTSTPWRLERDTYGVRRIWDSQLDCDIASTEGDGSIPFDIRIANAEFICRAVNSYDALLTACRFMSRVGCGCYSSDDQNWHSEKCAMPMIRAAIQKAEEQSK